MEKEKTRKWIRWSGYLTRLVLCGMCLSGVSERAAAQMMDAEHIPSLVIPANGETMRNPLHPVTSQEIRFWIRSTPLNAMTAGAIHVSINSNPWFNAVVTKDFSQEDSDYWLGSVFVMEGDSVIYYIDVTGPGYEQTFIYGDDDHSARTTDQGQAQAGAFTFTVTSLPTQTPTVTPGGSETPTPTPMIPTRTPTPSSTDSPTPTTIPPTETQLPAGTPTPTPTPTPSSGPDFELRLAMNAGFFTDNDPFLLQVRIWNRTGLPAQADLFLLLDVFGNFFFYPTWSTDLDFNAIVLNPTSTVPATYTILDFTWPPTQSSSATYARFYSAIFSPGTFNILGNFDSADFGWN